LGASSDAAVVVQVVGGVAQQIRGDVPVTCGEDDGGHAIGCGEGTGAGDGTGVAVLDDE
jgi:hypothetical protein